MDLVEKGVVTGAKKVVSPNKIIAGFILGSKRVYEFVSFPPNHDTLSTRNGS